MNKFTNLISSIITIALLVFLSVFMLKCVNENDIEENSSSDIETILSFDEPVISLTNETKDVIVKVSSNRGYNLEWSVDDSNKINIISFDNNSCLIEKKYTFTDFTYLNVKNKSDGISISIPVVCDTNIKELIFFGASHLIGNEPDALNNYIEEVTPGLIRLYFRLNLYDEFSGIYASTNEINYWINNCVDKESFYTLTGEYIEIGFNDGYFADGYQSFYIDIETYNFTRNGTFVLPVKIFSFETSVTIKTSFPGFGANLTFDWNEVII